MNVLQLPKTEDELKEDWGIERFVDAMGVLSGWYQDKGIPTSREEMGKLMVENADAFELFASRLYYSVAGE